MNYRHHFSLSLLIIVLFLGAAPTAQAHNCDSNSAAASGADGLDASHTHKSDEELQHCPPPSPPTGPLNPTLLFASGAFATFGWSATGNQGDVLFYQYAP